MNKEFLKDLAAGFFLSVTFYLLYLMLWSLS